MPIVFGLKTSDTAFTLIDCLEKLESKESPNTVSDDEGRPAKRSKANGNS